MKMIRTNQGFTLIELVIGTAILGTLTSIAIPNYLNQLMRTRQNECSAVMSQVITSSMGFNDEFSEYPQGWADLNSISAIMKESGSAANENNFDEINLSNGNYMMSAELKDPVLSFECISRKDPTEYNVLGCLNLTNGASEIKRGSKEVKVKASEVNCS